ncbi:unnamed protein product [Pleuronectes platessa]|uniref:Uncharacterized protein n=1 Tax=Pleuronectes platessa TaxID=8262 RepID=A0A9N7VBF9_PLEPL|nr:unnamed protein product [Pleuronectes platessa]
MGIAAQATCGAHFALELLLRRGQCRLMSCLVQMCRCPLSEDGMNSMQIRRQLLPGQRPDSGIKRARLHGATLWPLEWSFSKKKVAGSIPTLPHLHAEVSLARY